MFTRRGYFKCEKCGHQGYIMITWNRACAVTDDNPKCSCGRTLEETDRETYETERN